MRLVEILSVDVVYADDMASRPDLCTVVYRSGTMVEDSNFTRDMDACVRLFCDCFIFCGYTSTYIIQHEIFEVLTIFLICICVLWETTLCQLVQSCRDSEMFCASIFEVVAMCPGLAYCLHLQGLCSPRRYVYTLKVSAHSSAETSVKIY